MTQLPYTVVLRRPDYIGCDECITVVELVTVPFDIALPVAHAHDLAVSAAQAQAYEADRSMDPEDPDDYALIVLFAGHQPPLQYGE